MYNMYNMSHVRRAYVRRCALTLALTSRRTQSSFETDKSTHLAEDKQHWKRKGYYASRGPRLPKTFRPLVRPICRCPSPCHHSTSSHILSMWAPLASQCMDALCISRKCCCHPFRCSTRLHAATQPSPAR